MSLPLAACAIAITRRENMIESYSNPRKTREVLYFALKTKFL